MLKLAILVLLAGANFSESKATTVEKSGITYNVLIGNVYRCSRGTEIPTLRKGTVTDLLEAKYLAISNVQLKEIEPGAFGNLPQLKALEVSENSNWKVLKTGVFNSLTQLSRLDLSENGLTTIDSDAFDNMNNLYEVVLAGNRIQHYNPNWFANTPTLDHLTLDSNPIEEIPGNAFKNLKGRSNVYISFRDCKIKRIDDDAFQGLQSISLLQLDKNKLETLSGKYFENIPVEEIHVSDNKIRCQDNDDLSKVFVARSTTIGDNPWSQECLKKIRDWNRGDKNIIFDA